MYHRKIFFIKNVKKLLSVCVSVQDILLLEDSEKERKSLLNNGITQKFYIFIYRRIINPLIVTTPMIDMIKNYFFRVNYLLLKKRLLSSHQKNKSYVFVFN